MLPKSILRLKIHILLFCLVQALLSVVFGLYLLTHLPDFLEAEKLKSNEQLHGRHFNKTKLTVITERMSSEDGEALIVFRYDKFYNGFEYDNWLQMVTDEGKYAYFESGYMVDEIPDWFYVKESFCKGCLNIRGKRFGELANATINPEFAGGQVGGEELTNVMQQPLETEYLRLSKGFIETVSDQELDVPANYILNIELRSLLRSLTVRKMLNAEGENNVLSGKTAILITRYEYANFYHSTMNWYDTFLAMVVFSIPPNQLDVYWVDAHPKSNLDDIWQVLYGKCRRIRSLQYSVTYERMVWNGMGGRSPVNAHKLEDLPFINEYRHFVLSRYGIKSQHTINCMQLRVTIIWRRSYIAHPRNPDGFVARQIHNEEEVWQTVSDALPSATVNGVQLDKLTMLEQLELITTTDILIGMHGAGLSHILYLPKTSGVIELFTMRTSQGNSHFRSMSKWRRLPYIVWANSKSQNEMQNHRTTVPPTVLMKMVKTMKANLCSEITEP